MRKFLYALLFSAAVGSAVAAEADAVYKTAPIDTVFGQGEINPLSKYFTGTSYLQELSDNSEVFNAPISNVTFEPCTRTYWHKHTGGQILLVVAGEGRFQFRNEKPIIIKKGDIVRIPPDVEHWHGGGLNSWMSHLSLMPNNPGNETIWLEPVSDEEYRAEVQ